MKPVQSLIVAFAVGLATDVLGKGNLGDPAAPLKIATWVKGKPVDLSKGGGKQVYVIEFWATWCGPCRASIPHLSELQARFKDKGVTFVGVTDEAADTVKPFVAEMGAKMEYVVAVDDDEQTSKAYLEAYGVSGIPHAFVVDQAGRMVWHGHPDEDLDKVLDQVVAGKFDLEAARAAQAKQQAEADRMQAALKSAAAYLELVTTSADQEKARALSGKLIADNADNVELLNMLAWTVLDNQALKFRDVDFAMSAAKAALKASGAKDASVLDTYARALFETGKFDDAVKQQKLAVKLATSDDLKKELGERLAQYEKKAKAAGAK